MFTMFILEELMAYCLWCFLINHIVNIVNLLLFFFVFFLHKRQHDERTKSNSREVIICGPPLCGNCLHMYVLFVEYRALQLHCGKNEINQSATFFQTSKSYKKMSRRLEICYSIDCLQPVSYVYVSYTVYL